jgi:hypothetical protein
MSNAIIHDQDAVRVLTEQSGGQQAQGLGTISAAIAARDAARARYVYDIPAECVEDANGITALGFVKLLPDEQLVAFAAAKNDAGRLGTELARMSLRVVVYGEREVRLSMADGSSEKAWLGFDPKLRDLCALAYNRLHQPSEKAQRDFLASCKVKV